MGTHDGAPACLREVRDIRHSFQNHMADRKRHMDQLDRTLRECIAKVTRLSDAVHQACSQQESAADLQRTDDAHAKIISAGDSKYTQMKMEISKGWDALQSSIHAGSARKNLQFPESVDEVLGVLRQGGSADGCMADLFETHPSALPNLTSAIDCLDTVKSHLENELLELEQRAAALRSDQAFVRKEEYLKAQEEQKALLVQIEYQKRLAAIDAQHAEWQERTLPDRQNVVESHLQACRTLQGEFRRLTAMCPVDSNVKFFRRVLKKRIGRLRKSVATETQYIEQTKRDRHKRALVGQCVDTFPCRDSEESWSKFWSAFDEVAGDIYDLKRVRKSIRHNIEAVKGSIREEYDRHIDCITKSLSARNEIDIVTHLDVRPA
ncbi:replicative DNA helicase DnaC [Perkinsela sp. CCAP 1560/4]|nr:replicative DNA helicase DnaC [Perkinsela sp. CCAP 1560/4]|eukprot:KNH08668.1 replicative DNA helicase DnaC [Perkinsela sp. CCAP 1560/4]